jgi:hypothetical protein
MKQNPPDKTTQMVLDGELEEDERELAGIT